MHDNSTESESSDDDDFERKPERKKTISPSPKKKPAPKDGPKKVQVKFRPSPKRRRGALNALPPGQRPINNALNSLARRVLDKREITDEGSLVAAVLSSHRNSPKLKKSPVLDLIDESSIQRLCIRLN